MGLFMLALGVLLGWVSIFFIVPLEHAGIAERTASRLPFLGFACGLALGLAASLSKSAKEAVTYALLVPVTGGVFWFFGVLLGGVLVGLGVSSAHADVVPLIGFCLGVLCVVLPGALVGAERLRAFFSRKKPKT